MDIVRVEVLLLENRRRLVSWLRGMTSDADEAESLAQEVMVAVWRCHASIRDERSFTAFLFRVAVNRASSQTASRRRRPIEAGGIEWLTPPQPDAGSPLAVINRKRTVTARMRMLESVQLDVLRQCLCGFITYQEAATELGVPIGTIRARLHRLRQRLQREVRPDEPKTALEITDAVLRDVPYGFWVGGSPDEPPPGYSPESPEAGGAVL